MSPQRTSRGAKSPKDVRDATQLALQEACSRLPISCSQLPVAYRLFSCLLAVFSP